MEPELCFDPTDGNLEAEWRMTDRCEYLSISIESLELCAGGHFLEIRSMAEEGRTGHIVLIVLGCINGGYHRHLQPSQCAMEA